jgi:hypothetical protein
VKLARYMPMLARDHERLHRICTEKGMTVFLAIFMCVPLANYNIIQPAIRESRARLTYKGCGHSEEKSGYRRSSYTTGT